MCLSITVFNQSTQMSAWRRLCVCWSCSSFWLTTVARPVILDVRDFGGIADGETNNVIAIQQALLQCGASGGCRLLFPGVLGSIYRTSSIELISHLTLVVPKGVTLRGTETDHDNLADTMWPVLPWVEWPARPCASCPFTCAEGCGPAKRAWLHAHNVTDVELSGGGTLHGGGRFWWCAAAFDGAPRPPGGCDTQTLKNTCPPRTLHFVNSSHVHIHGLRMEHSPHWTLHIQFCNNVLIENVTIFNPNNATYRSDFGDGIDISSSMNVHIRDATIDVSGDATAVRAGSGLAGQQQSRPGVVGGRCSTRDVLFEGIEYRNGNGLSCKEDGLGGLQNITWSDIHVDGSGVEQIAVSRPGVARFEAYRSVGGVWEDITYANIRGGHVSFALSWDQGHVVPDKTWPLPPPSPQGNVTPLPSRFLNVVVRNVTLTHIENATVGSFVTLANSPVMNLVLEDLDLESSNDHASAPRWACNAFTAAGISRPGLYATGRADRISPPLGDCAFQLLESGQHPFYV